jgi:hypothetical protein
MTPFQALDALLITPFRLFNQPDAAFLFGVLAVAVLGAAIGRIGAALVDHSQRSRRVQQEGEAEKRSELSVQALQEGDKTAYLAQNHLAQEAYGNTLALSAGRAAGLLWPACGVLAWLAWRFDGVPMPFLWKNAGTPAYFIPVYILALWGLTRLLRK